MSAETMLASLRKAIKDDRYNVTALTVTCESDAATSALLEIVNGVLVITPSGGTATALNFNLETELYSTIGLLHAAINDSEGYIATLAPGAETSHASIDIEPTGPMEIVGVGYDLQTRMFSDVELTEILSRVTIRHNPSLSLNTVPAGEEPLVLALAQAEIYRTLANDAAKRKGMGLTVDECLRIAETHSRVYKDDFTRLNRILSSPRETSETIGSGDIMVGLLTRTSLRNGAATPVSAPLGQDCPVDWEPEEDQVVEDTVLEVHWSRKRPFDIWRVEIWRDTRPNVRRTVNQTLNPTTSTCVLSTRNNVTDRFRDTQLEPGTTYYYRAYIVDTTGEFVQSDVLTLTTKALKVSFGSPVVAPAVGSPGDTIQIALTGYVEGDTVVDMAGKILAGTWDPGTLLFTTTVPEFTHSGLKTLVVFSTGVSLYDVSTNAFRVP